MFETISILHDFEISIFYPTNVSIFGLNLRFFEKNFDFWPKFWFLAFKINFCSTTFSTCSIVPSSIVVKVLTDGLTCCDPDNLFPCKSLYRFFGHSASQLRYRICLLVNYDAIFWQDDKLAQINPSLKATLAEIDKSSDPLSARLDAVFYQAREFFWNCELHIILNRRNLEIWEHSSFFNYWTQIFLIVKSPRRLWNSVF